MEHIPVKDESGLVRDKYSGAILSSDLSIKKKYLEEQRRLANINKIESLEKDINELKNDMTDIKNMLQLLLNKGKTH